MNIVQHPDPRLRQRCAEVSECEVGLGLISMAVPPDIHIRDIVKEMLRTLRDAKGLGLAAPQVGIMYRIIVGYVSGHQFALVNPVILSKSARTRGGREGCLSYPGHQVYVERSMTIRVQGWDFSKPGQEPRLIDFQASDLLARCIQHEVDHLDGVCKVAPKEKAA